ncbi:MAG: HAD family hydrolase [Mesorhizobium amorphae]|nr:MAG: HAD family hydrolase [Mesorhizobium amorphae]
MTRLVILALEGVLVDTVRIVAEARAEVLAKAGIETSADELIEDFGGQGFTDILKAIEARDALPLQASLIGEAEALVDKRLKRETRAVEGVREALAGLELPFAAVSDEPASRVEAMLAASALAPLFKGRTFSSAEAGLPPRPAPDILERARGDVPASQCFVVDAFPVGIRAAGAAGMRALGFTGGEGAYPGLADRLTEAGAETVISRLTALPRTLAALGEWSEEG